MNKRRYKKPKINGRFEFEYKDNKTIIDNKWDVSLGLESTKEAKETIKFIRNYVKIHGGIIFGSFPYSYDQLLTEEQFLEVEEYEDDDELLQVWKKWGGWLII